MHGLEKESKFCKSTGNMRLNEELKDVFNSFRLSDFMMQASDRQRKEHKDGNFKLYMSNVGKKLAINVQWMMKYQP